MDAERLARVAAMARSIALSGERWSDEAEAEYRAALVAPAVTETDLLDKVVAAVEGLDSVPMGMDWPKGEVAKAYTVQWVRSDAVLDAIERIRRDDDGR